MTNIPNTDDGVAILKILDPGGNLSNEGCRQLLEVIMARSEVEKQYHSKISQKRITDINIDAGIEFFKHCQAVKPDMREKYFANILGTINSMMDYSIQKRIINVNPLKALSISKDLFQPKIYKCDEEQVYEDDERRRIRALAFETAFEKREGKYLAPILLLNFGVRDGELLALRWGDIKGNTIHVHSEFVEDSDADGGFTGYKLVDHTKTPAGDRFIINSEADKALKMIRSLNEEQNYPTDEEDFILQRYRKGKACPCTPRTIYNLISWMCKKLEIGVKSPHDMRRTFATTLYYNGTPIKEIQKIMGHSSVSQTEAYIKHKTLEDVEMYMESIV